MYRGSLLIPSLCLVIVFIISVEGQSNGPTYNEGGQENQGAVNRFRNMMSVNVPVFYDMVKNGNSMGINVLSGLVKVERGQEAERSGLVGPRPLSVRIFGIPVYERGTRIRPLEEPTRPIEPTEGEREPPRPKEPAGNEDELPIIP